MNRLAFGMRIPPKVAKVVAVGAGLFLVAACFNHGVMTLSTGLMESYHGRFHAAYVYQIFNGIIPPTNVHAAGEPVNFYWPWHVLIVSVMKIGQIAPFEANAIVGSLALGTTCLALFVLARRLGMTIAFSLGFPLFTLGMLRITTSATQLFKEVTLVGMDLRITSTVDKFLNFSSFPTAFAAFAAFALAFQWECVSRWRGDERVNPWCWVCTLAMGFFSPVTLLAYDLWIGLVVATQFDLSMSLEDARRRLQKEIIRYWPLVLCHIIIAPFLIRASSLMGGTTSIELAPLDLLRHLVAMQKMIWVFPVALIAGVYLQFRRLQSIDRARTRWFAWVGPIGLLLFPFIEMPDHNEYKIVLLWSLPLGLVIVLALSEIVKERSRATRILVPSMLLLCGAGSISANGWTRAHGEMAAVDPWAFSGTVTMLKGGDRTSRMEQEMVDWVRSNTAEVDFFVVPSVHWDRSRFSVLSQRRIVAARQSIHTDKLPNYRRLFEINWMLLAEIRREKRWPGIESDTLATALFEIVGEEQNFFAVLRKPEGEWWPEHPSLVYQNPAFVILTPEAGAQPD